MSDTKIGASLPVPGMHEVLLARATHAQQRLEGAGANSELEKARKAATDFEALMMGEMLKSMWRSVPSAGLLSGSREEELYRDMLTQAVAEQMATEQSLGIRDLVENEMVKRQSK